MMLLRRLLYARFGGLAFLAMAVTGAAGMLCVAPLTRAARA
jgi:hypothetical protein